MGFRIVRHQESQDVINPLVNSTLGCWLLRRFKKLQKGGARDEDDVRNHALFPGIIHYCHDAHFDPISVVGLQQSSALIDVTFPLSRQNWIFAAQVIHLTVKESVIEENRERGFHHLARSGKGVKLSSHHPYVINGSAHLIKELLNDFFFVSKVKIEISRTDLQVFGNVVCRDRHHAGLVKELDARSQNSLAVLGFSHRLPLRLIPHMNSRVRITRLGIARTVASLVGLCNYRMLNQGSNRSDPDLTRVN